MIFPLCILGILYKAAATVLLDSLPPSDQVLTLFSDEYRERRQLFKKVLLTFFREL